MQVVPLTHSFGWLWISQLCQYCKVACYITEKGRRGGAGGTNPTKQRCSMSCGFLYSWKRTCSLPWGNDFILHTAFLPKAHSSCPHRLGYREMKLLKHPCLALKNTVVMCIYHKINWVYSNQHSFQNITCQPKHIFGCMYLTFKYAHMTSGECIISIFSWNVIVLHSTVLFTSCYMLLNNN